MCEGYNHRTESLFVTHPHLFDALPQQFYKTGGAFMGPFQKADTGRLRESGKGTFPIQLNDKKQYHWISFWMNPSSSLSYNISIHGEPSCYSSLISGEAKFSAWLKLRGSQISLEQNIKMRYLEESRDYGNAHSNVSTPDASQQIFLVLWQQSPNHVNATLSLAFQPSKQYMGSNVGRMPTERYENDYNSDCWFVIPNSPMLDLWLGGYWFNACEPWMLYMFEGLMGTLLLLTGGLLIYLGTSHVKGLSYVQGSSHVEDAKVD